MTTNSKFCRLSFNSRSLLVYALRSPLLLLEGSFIPSSKLRFAEFSMAAIHPFQGCFQMFVLFVLLSSGLFTMKYDTMNKSGRTRESLPLVDDVAVQSRVPELPTSPFIYGSYLERLPGVMALFDQTNLLECQALICNIDNCLILLIRCAFLNTMEKIDRTKKKKTLREDRNVCWRSLVVL